MAISSELERQLSGWLPRQAWFPRQDVDLGSDPDVTPMSETRLFEFDGPDGSVVQGIAAILAVGDGPSMRRLNVPLVFRTAEDFALRSHLIGTVEDMTLGRCWVYDAAADPVFVLTLAAALATGRRFQGGQVQALQVSRGNDDFLELDSPAALLERAATTEIAVTDHRRGETTVSIDDVATPSSLTLFRVLTPGMSAGVRIPVVLASAGSHTVPPVMGWAAGRWFDARDLTTLTAPLAMLTRSEASAQPAWREAVDTAVSVDSGSIGSFNKRAAALGARVGELHHDLAREFGQVPGDARQTKNWVRKWTERVDWALARAPLALSGLEEPLRRHRASLAELDTVGALQRIHGDLTLNHVVSGPTSGFTAVSFADSAGVDDTHADPKPAALDLVALLRSLDYAAGYARLRRTGALDVDARPATLGVTGLGESDADLREVVDSPEYLWSAQAQNALLTGYSHAVDASVGLHDPVLRAVLVDRLLVEVVAELRNRPAWLIVPLASLTLLLAGRQPGGSARGAAADRPDPAAEAPAGQGGPGADGAAWRARGATVSAEEFAESAEAAAGAEALAAELGVDAPEGARADSVQAEGAQAGPDAESAPEYVHAPEPGSHEAADAADAAGDEEAAGDAEGAKRGPADAGDAAAHGTGHGEGTAVDDAVDDDAADDDADDEADDDADDEGDAPFAPKSARPH